MSLSVCLLTRNDESRLTRLLPSVAGIADEVLVADTGSTDRTAAVARSFGARVLSAGWDDDYSQARNHAIDQADGDWILWFNADEELDRTTVPALRGCLARPDALAYELRVWDYARPEPSAWSETLQPRLFRNGRGIAYRGRIHPDFHPALEDIARQRGARLLRAEVRIRRHGYAARQSDEELRVAVRLLEKELYDRPGQFHYQIALGRTLLQLKDMRGHEVLAQATAQMKRLNGWPTPPTPSAAALLEYLLTCSIAARALMPRAQVEELAERWFPAAPPVLWALALRACRDHDYERARGLLERLIAATAGDDYDRAMPFEPAVLSGLGWLNLGACCAKLGDLDRAEQCFAQLLTMLGFEQQGRHYHAWVREQRAAQR